MREAIAAYFASINGEDWDRLAGLFREDAELRAPGTRPRVGGEAVAGYYSDALRPYPVHRDEPTRELYAGDTVTVEIHFEGELANGRPMSFDAVDVFDFRDGRIARLTSWYDSQRVVAELLEATAATAVEGDGLAQLTPARVRWAFTRAGRGRPFRLLGGSWTALGADRRGQAIVARALVLDLAGAARVDAAALDAAASRQRADVRAGDIVLVHTGAGERELAALGDWAGEHRIAGLAIDGPVAGAPPDLAVGSGWTLDELAADCRERGSCDGLLVSLPAATADPDANAVVFR